MMVNALPTHRELLRSQQMLPTPMRQNCLLIEFTKPIPEHRCGEFMRVRFTAEMLAGGAKQFFKPSVFQPHRVAPAKCRSCNRQMRPFAEFRFKCENPACDAYRKEQRFGPAKGIVQVLTFDEHIHRDVERGNLASACVLILDRQYDDDVLCAVKRTCLELAETEWSGVLVK
jgi:hypothetical protein